MNYIDRFLNNITMYRLVLNVLRALTIFSFIASFFGFLDFSVLTLTYSLVIITVISYVTNVVFAKLYKIEASNESYAITAFILFLILYPPTSIEDAIIVALTAFIAQASKYLLNWQGRHIFNPAAISLTIISILGYGNSIWWVGSVELFPLVLIGGLLIVRKIRRFPLFFTFVLVAGVESFLVASGNGAGPQEAILNILISSPLIFFASVMLTEPATMPASTKMQLVFALLVGSLFSIGWHIGPLYSSPHAALCIGNLFALFISYRPKLVLYLKEKRELAPNLLELVFTNTNKKFSFLPGQYMEWTHAHPKPDNRGVRRFFTIASSPTEDTVKIGIRVQNEGGSTFKNALKEMKEGEEMLAMSLAGDFVLPSSANKKLGFIAGGIGITPFRSMVKYLTDKEEKRDVVLLYSANKETDFAYTDIFKEGEKIGLKTIYAITVPENVPHEWKGVGGAVTKEEIGRRIPDYKSREWYISGPNAMVEAYATMLKELGVSNKDIIKDYFPGF